MPMSPPARPTLSRAASSADILRWSPPPGPRCAPPSQARRAQPPRLPAARLAHHLLDLRLPSAASSAPRPAAPGPLGRQHDLFAALGPLAEDARQEEHRRVGGGMDRVVEPVPGLGQVVQREACVPAERVPGQGQEVEHREEVDQARDRQHDVAALDQPLRPDLRLDRASRVIRSCSWKIVLTSKSAKATVEQIAEMNR